MEDHYKTIFHSLQNPSIIVDDDFRIENLNLNAFEMLKDSCEKDSHFSGIFQCSPPVESTTMPIEDLMPDFLNGKRLDDVFPWMKEEILSFNKNSETRLIFEKKFEESDNATHLKVKMTRLMDAGKPVSGTFVTLIDITVQKRMEEMIRASERTMRSLLNAMPEAGFLIDPHGMVMAANRAAAKLIDTAINKIAGLNIFSLMPEELAKSRWNFFVKALDKGAPVEFGDSHGDKYYDNYFTPIKNDNGIVTRLAFFCHDVTEKKMTVMNLEKRNTELSIINKMSSSVVKSIEAEELFEEVFNSMSGLKDLGIRADGSIFINDGGRLKKVFKCGPVESCCEKDGIIDFGDCLCGLAAEKEEIIYEKNAGDTPGVELGCKGDPPHGHLVLPLKAKSKLVGILNLQLDPGTDIEESMMNMLTLGNQIGMALENARLYRETRKLALHDPLTGLANRRLMDILFERNLNLTIRNKKPFSVIMADIDGFKKYNDTNGHTEGDRVLMETATTLMENIRLMDLAVRYGGEEFLVLLPETDIDAAHEVAERLRENVEGELDVTISLGVAGYDEGLTKEDIIMNADSALYTAKQNGRNKVEVYVNNGK